MKKPLCRCLAILAALLTLHMPLLADSQGQLTTLANNTGDTGKIVDGGQGTGTPPGVGIGGTGQGATGPATTAPATTPTRQNVTTNPPNPDSHVISAQGGKTPFDFLQKKSTIMLASGLLGGIIGAFVLGGLPGLLVGGLLGLAAGYIATNYFDAGKGGKK